MNHSVSNSQSTQAESLSEAQSSEREILIGGKFSVIEILTSNTETKYVVLDPDCQDTFVMQTLPGKYIGDESYQNRFARHSSAWIQLGPHENLVRAEVLNRLDGIPYLYAEHVQGENLEHLMDNGFLAIRSSIEIAIQICAALDHAITQSGIAHRDITPSNILLSEDDIAKIDNFGMARIFDNSLGNDSLADFCRKIDSRSISIEDFPLHESLPYTAPELFADLDRAGPASDIYAVGVILYRLLTDINPFSDETPSQIMANHLSRVPENPQGINRHIRDPLARLVLKCLEKDPERRYRDFATLHSELRRIYLELTGAHFEKPRIQQYIDGGYRSRKELSVSEPDPQLESAEPIDEALSVKSELLMGRQHLIDAYERSPGIDIELLKSQILSDGSTPRRRPEPGSLLDGKFTVNEVITARNEVICLAFDPEYQIYFAVRTLPDLYLEDAAILDSFLTHAARWSQLESHPNIVKAGVMKVLGGIPYLFTEHIPGNDIEHILKKGLLSLRSTVEIAIQICAGLEHAISLTGGPHRDLKPSNILISDEDVVKINNFGMTHILDEMFRADSLANICRKIEAEEMSLQDLPVYDSLPYMAPELFTSIDSAGASSDIYAFGIILYRLLTNYNPFSGESPVRIMSNHLSRTPMSPHKMNPEIPESLSHLVMRCMDKEQESRYSDFSRILSELRHIYHELTGSEFEKPEIEQDVNEDFWINKGLSLKSVNCADEAVQAFEEALRIYPESLRARYYIGSSLEQRIEEGMSDSPQNWEFWFWNGEAYRASGDPANALKCYDNSLSLNEREELVWAMKAKLLMDTGKLEDALKCYDRALYYNPRAAEILCSRGNLLLRMKHYQAALNCFKEALFRNPTYNWTLFYQGIALFNLRRYREALNTHEKVLERDPGFHFSWIRIGDCHAELGKKTEAMNAYRSAIELQENCLEAYLGCIQILKEDGKWEQALEYIERGLALKPSDPAITLDKAEVLFKLGYFEESRSLCEGILEKEPTQEHAKTLLGATSRLQEERDLLFNDLFPGQAVKAEAYSNDLNGLLAVFCSIPDAISHLENHKKDDAGASYLIGCLYFAEGQLDNAMRYAIKAFDAPQCREKAQALKARIEECAASDASGGGKKKDLFQFAKKLLKKESDLDEAIMEALKKMHDNELQDARAAFREIMTKNAHAYSCLYFTARTYEMENNFEKAKQFYGEFELFVPNSIGFLRNKLRTGRDADPESKEKDYRTLVGDYPYDCTIWVEYLQFLSEKGYGEKIRLLASSLLSDTFKEWDSQKETPMFWNLRGYLQLCRCRYGEAEASFKKSLEYDAEDMSALLGIGKCHEESGRLEEAGEHYKNLMTREETYGIASYLLTHLFLKDKQGIKALGTIESALHKSPESLPLLYKKAEVLAHLKMSDELSAFYEHITYLNIAFSPVKVLRCKTLIEEGHLDDAGRELSKSLPLNKGNLVIGKNLAYLQVQTRDYDRALAAFEEILSRYSLDFGICVGPGIIHYMNKRYDRACESFHKALELDPFSPDLWILLGAAKYHLNQMDESSSCWETALYYGRKYIAAWINKGAYLYYRGKFPQAEECAEYALAKEPQNLPATLIKAKCQWKRGNLDGAAEILEKASALHLDDARVWSLYGTVEFYRKSYRTGYEHFVKATGIDNTGAELWYNKALLGINLRAYDNARTALEQALALNPELEEAVMLRCALAVITNEEGKNNLVSAVQQKFPEGYQAWTEEYKNTNNILSYFTPGEIHEDPFTLTFIPPPGLIEPIGLCHLLSPHNLI